MKVKFKSSLLTFLILVIIGILLFFNYYYFKLAPTMLYDSEDQEILELFEVNNNLYDLKLESRYAFNDVYYSAVDEEYIYFFLTNGNLVLSEDKSKLNYDKVLNIADTMFNGLDNNIYLSIYKKQPVYVIVNEDYDIFIDFDSYEEVFRFRKGISDE